MNPCYMDFGEVIPQHCTLQHEKKSEIRVEPNLFRLVNALGPGSSLVGLK